MHQKWSKVVVRKLRRTEMSAVKKIPPAESEVLSEALMNIAKPLGLTQAELGKAIGKDRSTIARGLQPQSKAGELALMLIRCYRSLYVLVGGKPEQMAHWMHTENRHTGGVPAEQIMSIVGLTRVMQYLDAIRGKV